MSRREDLDLVAEAIKVARDPENVPALKFATMLPALLKLAAFAQAHLDALDAKRFLGYTGGEFTKPTAAELDLREALGSWIRGQALATAARRLEEAARSPSDIPIMPAPTLTVLQRAAIIYTHTVLSTAPMPTGDREFRGYNIALNHLQRIIAP